MRAIELLKNLIKTESFSGNENGTASLISEYLKESEILVERHKNNIVSINKKFNPNLKTILLNSHHDTVKVNDGWTKNPFGATEEEGVIYGLGANDAGASLVSLIDVFIDLYNEALPFNLILAATAEEENFGPNGLSMLLDGILPDIDFGIIGEPTTLQLGAAQKGLIVIDGVVKGKAGHAARDTGINAIYACLPDIEKINGYRFERISEYLGITSVVLTQINAGTQHNVIPDHCSFVLDVRVNDLYTLQEVLDELRSILKAELTPRSLRWHSRGIHDDHPILEVCRKLGIKAFGSPTLSDQVHCSFPTVKIGPGESERSHTADEFIKRSEIEKGIKCYHDILKIIRL